MKTFALFTLFTVAPLLCFAQKAGSPSHEEAAASADTSSDEFSQATAPKIAGWGKAVDPDRDCKFFLSKSTLIISTPASLNPHDFAPELSITNAPRVTQTVTGDFSFQVRVDDRMQPGDESTLPGRVGYNGASVVAIADGQNVVTLARAVMQWPGEEAVPYANFEIRAGGELQRIGLSGDHPLPKTGPVFLRLERRGQQITGSVSTNGSDWSTVRSETLPDGWAAKSHVGVMTVNSSKVDFSPQFSQIQISK